MVKARERWAQLVPSLTKVALPTSIRVVWIKFSGTNGLAFSEESVNKKQRFVTLKRTDKSH
jgi:hypothetical protein